jgi:hypothetical protein
MIYANQEYLFAHDFQFYWAAAQIILDGGNAYKEFAVSNYLAQHGIAKDSLQFFPYPVWSLWLFLFFGLFSFETGRVLWMIAVVSSLALCIFTIRKIIVEFFTDDIPSNSRKGILTMLTAALLFPPLSQSIAWGQASPFVLLGICLYIFFILKDQHFKAGFFLSLSIIKPQLLLPLVLFISVVAVREKKLSDLFGFAVGSLIQLLVMLAFAPEAVETFLISLPEVSRFAQQYTSNTFTSFLLNQNTPLFIVRFIEFCPYVFAVFLGARTSGNTLEDDEKRIFFFNIHYILIATLFCSRYAWGHAYIILLSAWVYTYCMVLQSSLKQSGKTIIPLIGAYSLFCISLMYATKEVYAEVPMVLYLCFLCLFFRSPQKQSSLNCLQEPGSHLKIPS